MGDPNDFKTGGPLTRVPKELWDSLDTMAVVVERILTHYGADMNRRDLAARQKELATAHRILDKYRARKEPKSIPLREETLKSIILLLLDQVDYTARNCSPTAMVAAVLPAEIITKARESLHA